ncbi:enoyl-CoA hydratase/isomerase family protein [Falsiroseomonas selenitidurans]|uniref:Enoyl-CoA hydratase/isomerase family protein n=1 Tax=Falsiroseomonas selenitidurans TaxID=2716335 RepID=A0ABX1E5U6_9PROT|nr:enoyl-CoA hydratase/isomerase family protein [Falsiroseomonas selenitidurans]NKC30310.1 enoyl-CoA hydratase/isomerase family protein [Falsiroseomonas selenitidurans]
MDDGQVTLAVADGVARLTLDRPAKHNAITNAMAEQLAQHARAINLDDSVRAVLLQGAGERAFCAGMDLRAIEAFPSAWDFRHRPDYPGAVRGIRKPVVAALKGWALGGGFELALAADIRVAGQSTRIGFPEVTRGWVGGGGASQMLPRLVGVGQAMRLLLTGEQVDAAEALRLRLVEQVVADADVPATALALCERLAAFSPVAVQAVKACVRHALEMPLSAGLAYENEMNVLCLAALREGGRA